MGDPRTAAGGGPIPVKQVVNLVGDIIRLGKDSPDILKQLETLSENTESLARENRELRENLQAAEKKLSATVDRMRAESLELAAKLKESEKNRTANLDELKATIDGLRKKIAELEKDVDDKTKRAAYYQQSAAMFQPMAANWQSLQNMLTQTAAPAGYPLPAQQMMAPPPPPPQRQQAPAPAAAPAPVQLPTPQPAPAPSPPKTGAPAKDPYEYTGTTDDDAAASGPEREESPPLAADNGDPPGPPTAAVAKVAGSTVVINNSGAAQKSKPRETAAKRKQPEPEVDKIYNYNRFTLMTRVSSKSGPKNQRLLSDIGPDPEKQFVYESEGSGRKPAEKSFRGPSMFQTRIKSLKEHDFDDKDVGGAGGRLPDPTTWAKNPEMRRYLERLRDLWQNGDIEGPIGRYIESSAAELSDFMEELNAFKSKSWGQVFAFFNRIEREAYTGETDTAEEDEGGDGTPGPRRTAQQAKPLQALSKPANVSPPATKKQRTYADGAGPATKA